MNINRHRMMADVEAPFVVFLFGIRINVLWKIHRWLPVFHAMRKMLKELYAKPNLGFMGHESWFGNPWLTVQYWRSFDALLSYAGSQNAEHLPAWIAFKDVYSKGAAVGIWHEAYVVQPGQFETTYKNMPAFGLGRATRLTLYHGPLINLKQKKRLDD